MSFVSRAPQSYGETVLRDVDEVHTCDANDPHAVLAAVRALHEKRLLLRGIITTADLYALIAALAARELALPGMSPERQRLVRNQHAMRERPEERIPPNAREPTWSRPPNARVCSPIR